MKSGVYKYKDLEVLVHDYRLSMYIWQAPTETLPSNPVYREFYRDLGLDVTPKYFRDLAIEIAPQRQGHVWTGFKYFANSGSQVDLGHKSLYDVTAAEKQAVQGRTTFPKALTREATPHSRPVIFHFGF